VHALGSRVVSAVPQTLALLASTQQEPATLIIARSDDLDFSCATLLRQALEEMGLRGGGSASLAQSQVPAKQLDELFARLEGEVRGQLKIPQPAK